MESDNESPSVRICRANEQLAGRLITAVGLTLISRPARTPDFRGFSRIFGHLTTSSGTSGQASATAGGMSPPPYPGRGVTLHPLKFAWNRHFARFGKSLRGLLAATPRTGQPSRCVSCFTVIRQGGIPSSEIGHLNICRAGVRPTKRRNTL
jgi:hypothetical protein